LFALLGARILTREKNMLIKRHGSPFLVLARPPAASPSRPSERTRDTSSEGGNTGRRTDWPCHINIAEKVRLLRPSVQLPAGIHGCGVYKDFECDGKGYEPNWPRAARPGTGAGLTQPCPAVSFGPDFRDIL